MFEYDQKRLPRQNGRNTGYRLASSAIEFNFKNEGPIPKEGSNFWQLALRRRMTEKAREYRDAGVWYRKLALEAPQLLSVKSLFHSSFARSLIHSHALCGSTTYRTLRTTRTPSSQTTGDVIALSTHFHPWYRESP